MKCIEAALPAACCLAATPKERQRYSKKCAAIITNLKQRVEQYNQLVAQYSSEQPAGSLQRQPAQLEDVRNHRFCWVNEYTGV
jgi:hypothetical protein